MHRLKIKPFCLFVWIMELALNFDPIIRINYIRTYICSDQNSMYTIYTINIITHWILIKLRYSVKNHAFAMFICCNNPSILSHQNSIKDFARRNFDTQLTKFTLYTKQIRRMHDDKRFINSNKRETGLKTKKKSRSIWIENQALDYVESR